MRRLALPFAWLCCVLALPGCRGRAIEQPAVEKNPKRFDEAIQILLADGAIATDDDLKIYADQNLLLPTFVAPKSWRTFLQNPGLHKPFTPTLAFHWREGTISLIWSGQLTILGDRAKAEKALLKIVADQELTDSKGKGNSPLAAEFSAAVKSREESLRKNNIAPETQPPVATLFARTTGRATEELLIRDFAPLVGVREPACRGSCQWGVTCDYTGQAPTLKALLQAVPALEPLHREDKLFDRLQDEPIFAYSNLARLAKPDRSGMWRLSTSAKIRGDVEAILKAQGFAPTKPAEAPAPEQTWQRLANATFVNLSEDKENKERLWIQCQAPQR